jgi:hypothetical protein
MDTGAVICVVRRTGFHTGGILIFQTGNVKINTFLLSNNSNNNNNNNNNNNKLHGADSFLRS